jgi:hypothetical protein
MRIGYTLIFRDGQSGTMLELNTYDTFEKCKIAADSVGQSKTFLWIDPDKKEYILPGRYYCLPKPFNE